MTRTVAQGNMYERPTERQWTYADALARKAGYRSADDARRERNGKSRIGSMTRAEMSALIDWLQNR